MLGRVGVLKLNLQPAASLTAARRFYRSALTVANPAAAAAAAAATASAKPAKASKPPTPAVPIEAVPTPKPVHNHKTKPTPVQPRVEPLRTSADVAKFIAARNAMMAARVKPPARPVVELAREAEKKNRGMPVFNVKWRPKTESISLIREEHRVPGSIATRQVEGDRTYLSITLPRKDVLAELKKNTIHCRVFELRVSGVPGHENEVLTYKAVCTRIRKPPLGDGLQSIDFVLFEPYKPTRVLVPVQFEGVEDCIGKKHGGLLYFQNDRVDCYWCGDEQIPDRFIVDVQAADVGTAFHISDLYFPKGLRPATTINRMLCKVRGTSIKDDEPVAGAAGGAPGAGGAAPAAGGAGGTAPAGGAAAAAGDKKADDKKAADKKK